MASTNSTEHLQLNQWSGTDRPKMADFNADNQKIDGALHAHTADGAAHVSAQERAAWTGAVPVLGSYEGDGQPMQEISLGFSPAFGIVFAAGENPFQPVDQTTVALRAAFLAGGRFFTGRAGHRDGVFGAQFGNARLRTVAALNEAGVTYQYLVFR